MGLLLHLSVPGTCVRRSFSFAFCPVLRLLTAAWLARARVLSCRGFRYTTSGSPCACSSSAVPRQFRRPRSGQMTTASSSPYTGWCRALDRPCSCLCRLRASQRPTFDPSGPRAVRYDMVLSDMIWCSLCGCLANETRAVRRHGRTQFGRVRASGVHR